MSYYNDLLESLQTSNTPEVRSKKFIHPLSLYYLCDYYYGEEISSRDIIYIKDKKELTTDNVKDLKDFDIIHIQKQFFPYFCLNILNRINKKIIITTGQYHISSPLIIKSDLSEQIMNNPNVVLWISQNPIYPPGGKYIAFPYGMNYNNLEAYTSVLLNSNKIQKDIDIMHLPVSPTHPCRFKLPFIPNIPIIDFYNKMARANFIMSPIGDRDDCYRHYEAIGLGTIPISNTDLDLHVSIFGNNMCYRSINHMCGILAGQLVVGMNYNVPDKNLICYEFHRDNILKIIENLKKKYL